MKDAIAAARAEGDSVGGVVEATVKGLPVGVGDPMFGGLENRLAQAVFGIPAVKGIEFGEGFAAAELKGSENNDPYGIVDGEVMPLTNHAGGILGGLSTGAPLVFRVAFKPTPSIAKEQDSVDLATRTPVKLVVKGRHDPCVVLRAVPCVEAAAAIALYDAILEWRKECA
jgi:chorismate synthase